MRIAIIGAGKVGIALGYVLRKKGFDVVAVASRRQSSLGTAKTYIGADCFTTLDNRQVVEMADVVAVTTQDREIKHVAAQIAAVEGRLDGKLFFHTNKGAPSSGRCTPFRLFLISTPASGVFPTPISLSKATPGRFPCLESSHQP
jgi:2-polyprenyl-6-methoxyphenol hydroxylase-like FAD-dependent oxidoreductase